MELGFVFLIARKRKGVTAIRESLNWRGCFPCAAVAPALILSCPGFKVYLSKLQNVFVQIAKCICSYMLKSVFGWNAKSRGCFPWVAVAAAPLPLQHAFCCFNNLIQPNFVWNQNLASMISTQFNLWADEMIGWIGARAGNVQWVSLVSRQAARVQGHSKILFQTILPTWEVYVHDISQQLCQMCNPNRPASIENRQACESKFCGEHIWAQLTPSQVKV